MLEPDERRPGGVRAVVTDFGLARRDRPGRGSARAADRNGGRDRNAGLHGARADRGPRDHAGNGRLCARRRPLRDGHRRAAVRGRHAPVRGVEEAQGGRAFAAKARTRPAAGLGEDDPALPRARAGRPLRLRQRGRAGAPGRGDRHGAGDSPAPPQTDGGRRRGTPARGGRRFRRVARSRAPARGRAGRRHRAGTPPIDRGARVQEPRGQARGGLGLDGALGDADHGARGRRHAAGHPERGRRAGQDRPRDPGRRHARQGDARPRPHEHRSGPRAPRLLPRDRPRRGRADPPRPAPAGHRRR